MAHGARAWTFTWPTDYGEGPLLDQARRAAAGENIYRSDFGPYHGLISNYPPVYPYLVGICAKIFGSSIQLARFLTVVATLTCALLVGVTVRAITQRRSPAALAIGLFLASPSVLFWSMFARVDFLALSFVLASLALVVCRPRGRWTLRLAFVLSIAAIFTKQSCLLAGPLAVATATWTHSPRRAGFFLIALALSIAAIVFLLQVTTDGGFWAHTVTANVQPYTFGRLWVAGVWFLKTSFLLLAVVVLEMFRSPPRQLESFESRCARRTVAAFFVGALVSAFTVGKHGSSVNHFLPLVAASAIVGGLAFARSSNPIARDGGQSELTSRIVPLILIGQVLWMFGFAAVDLPDRGEEHKLAQSAEMEELATLVRAEHGSVIADAAMGVVVTSGHALVIDPFDLTECVQQKTASQERFVADLRSQAFSLILVDEDDSTSERWTTEMLDAIHGSYRRTIVLAGTSVYRPDRARAFEDVNVPSSNAGASSRSWASPFKRRFWSSPISSALVPKKNSTRAELRARPPRRREMVE
ncbi:MAG: glycosyltransferase family 39 protein [Polyangiaceae bacterium]